MSNQFKIFVMPDTSTEVETVYCTEFTMADTKATVCKVVDEAVQRLLDAGVRDLRVDTGLEESDTYGVLLTWVFPGCEEGHIHDALVSGRLVQS